MTDHPTPVRGGAAAFPAARRAPIKLSPDALVATSLLEPGAHLPLVYRPCVEHVAFVRWAGEHQAEITARLRQEGALLFRGFGLRDVAAFADAARALSSGLLSYGERSSPRTQISEGVYTSTEHPASEPILLHTEQSYTLNWPMKICFFCVQPAVRGGQTPLADTRRILRRLPPDLVDAFGHRQVMYVRNYGEGLGLSWQEAFQTTDRAEVEAHCRRMSIDSVWRGGDRLRTHQVRPALRRHPVTNDLLWFNHAAFFHFSSLGPDVQRSILAVMAEEDVAFNTYYGDGGPIEPDVLDTIRAAYRDETVRFVWEQGDLLMLDNMLTAHGRDPFEGPRRVAVAMAESVQADPHGPPAMEERASR